MGSETFSNIHVIGSFEKADDDIVDPSSFFSFIFDANHAENLNSTLQFIFSDKNKKQFSLALKTTRRDELSQNCLDKLCLILCHPNYLKFHSTTILVIHPNAAFLHKGDFLARLSLKLKEQGLEELMILDFSGEQTKIPGQPYILYKSHGKERFYEWYVQQLANSQSLLNIFVDSESKANIKELASLKNDAEERIKIEEPLFYCALKSLYAKSFEAGEYKALVNLMAEDLSSKKAYLDFVLGKFKEGQNAEQIDMNVIMQIKKFYNYEYEVLPLWYKRFGHILKVIMGKRTFRSLFRDNVKKYKD